MEIRQRDYGDRYHGQPHVHEGAGPTALAQLLDLDASVLHSYLFDVTTWVRGFAAGRPRRRVLDLGAGTGAGTIALAQRFSGADVIAVDVSEDMLTRVRAKAFFGGFAQRIRTVQADLNVHWPAIEPVDVAWAASSLHELADPERVLRDIFTAINPDGLLAVAEMGAPPRFLPDDIGLGRPGLESRCHDVLNQVQANGEPHPDWGPFLARTGFELLAKRTFDIRRAAPHQMAAGRYARAYLQRIRPVIEARIAPDDLAILDILLAGDGPESLLHRNDLIVRGSRTGWVARRP